MTRSWIGRFIAEDIAFVRDRPNTYGTVIGQLQRLERLMNNQSKSQRIQKKKKEHMAYLPPEKLDTSHRKSDDWISA